MNQQTLSTTAPMDELLPLIGEVEADGGDVTFDPDTAETVDLATPANERPVTIYERLVEYNLLRKLTDIVMAKVSLPWHLRLDAVQEVHASWGTLRAKPGYQRDQLAKYAYLSGKHAALRLRRTIGAAVVIPGALFRTGRDSAFMESIGAAVNPKDVEDYKDSIELSVDPVDLTYTAPLSEAYLRTRLVGLVLSPKQQQVVIEVLVNRTPVDVLAEKMNTQVAYIERLLNQVTAKMEAKNEARSCATRSVPMSRPPSRASATRRSSTSGSRKSVKKA